MPAPRIRPAPGRDAEYSASLARGNKAILAHAKRLFPAEAVYRLRVVVDELYDQAVERGASPEDLAKVAEAAIDLDYALTQGEFHAHRTAEGWYELAVALHRADEGLRSLGSMIADRPEIHIVMAAAAKRENWGKR